MVSSAQKKAVSASRHRAAQRGLVRVEVLVPKRGAELIKGMAADLRRGFAENEKAPGGAAPKRKFVSAAEAFASDLPDEYFEGVFDEGPRTDRGRDIDL